MTMQLVGEWMPDDPPILDGLKEWCSKNAEEAVKQAIEGCSLFWNMDSEDPLLEVIFDIDYVDEEGLIESRHKRFKAEDLLCPEGYFDRDQELKIAEMLSGIATKIVMRGKS